MREEFNGVTCYHHLVLIVEGLTVPLVVTENGEKLGKTAGNAVWLDQTITGSQPLTMYLDKLSVQDLLPLAHQLTLESTDQLQVCTW